jgi:ubiquinone biosynthesis protein
MAKPLRRHRGATFGLAFVISATTHIARLVRAAYVFAREGVFGVVDPGLVPPPGQLALRLARIIERPGAKSGPRLSRALTRLGPAYLKLGQFLATRPDVVGVAMALDLESLQDRLPPFPQSEAEAVIATSLERPVAQAFASLGPSVAAASIAQVHRGEVERGGVRTSVAVKVLRPHVASRFRRDLADFFFVARSAEAHSADARRLRLIEVINTMSRSVAIEMDLRLEAAAMSEMAENTRNDPDFRVPTVDWDRTTHNVLTMEWIDGIALNDHARLEQSQVDLPDLGRKVIQSFLRHALRDGFFHADMHPGNLFLDDTGRLVAVDFGIMGRLGQKERRFLAEILLGFITRDYRRVAEVHFEAGYVPGHHSVENFAQAIRAIGEPIHNRIAEDISMAKLLTLLLEVTGLFDMQTRPELILLQKTMVVVEGVARGFDPKLDIWKVADPVVREWIERNLGPIGRIQGAVSGAGDLGRVLAGLPAIAARSVTVLEQLEKMTREGITLSPETIAAMGRAEGRKSRWRTVALWIIAVTFIGILVAVRQM